MLNFSSIRVISGRAWVLAGLSALLQIGSFPIAGPLPYLRSGLGWVALVPLLCALCSRDADGRSLRASSAGWLGYFCGVLWYAGNCYWIYQTMYLYGGLPKPVALVILFLFALYLGLYHALFGWLFGVLRSSKASVAGAFIMAPFAWVAVELARARITGFPWDLLGNSQIDNLLVTRIAVVAGVMGISFLVVLVNAGLAGALLLRGRPRWIAGVSCLAVLVIAMVGGRLHGLEQAGRDVPMATAVLMQDNVEVGAVGRGVGPVNPANEMRDYSYRSLHPEMSGTQAVGGGRLVVWPEAPSELLTNDPYFRLAMSKLAQAADAPLIIGSIAVDLSASTERGYFAYNSAAWFDAAGVYKGHYDKIHLVPWGEYVPYKKLFAFADKLTQGVGNMDPGTERRVFITGGHTYGVFICYESIFGDEVREFVKSGAEVLVNISDDGWYGDTGAPWQHLNMARMRAIENDRYVVRSTNTGITTVIDPRGRVEVEAPRHVRGAFAFGFGYESGMTFYTRFGDWLAYLCLVVTAFGLGLTRIRRL